MSKKAVTIEDLEKTHGSAANAVYNEICKIGGFGRIGHDFLGGRPALDISGCSPEARAAIDKLLNPGEGQKPAGASGSGHPPPARKF